MAPFSWSHVIQIRRSPQDPKLILEDVIYILFWAQYFSVSSKLKALKHTMFDASAQTWAHVEGVDITFPNQCESLRASGNLDYAERSCWSRCFSTF